MKYLAQMALFTGVCLFLAFCTTRTSKNKLSKKTENEVLVLQGGTLIDLDNFGKSSNDIEYSVIVIEKGKIKEVGELNKVRIPSNAKIINVKGHYIMPGLIDGFATINEQSYANAFLYHGVTTIVGLPEGGRRGTLFMEANPSPKIMLLGDFISPKDHDKKENATVKYGNKKQINELIDSLANTGVKVLWVPYATQAFQLPLIVEACNKRGLVTIAELGDASVLIT